MGEIRGALKRLQLDHGVTFCAIEDGKMVVQRVIQRESIDSCPHTILMPNHYREDASCRCDDPEHARMIDWGYTWNGLTWEADLCDDPE